MSEATGEATLKVRVGMAVTAPEPDVGVEGAGVTVMLNVPVACGNDGIVGGWIKVGVAGLGDAQADSKVHPNSRAGIINLMSIFTSIDNYISCHIITENRKAETRTSRHYTTV
jgi:hypothetical protein